MLSGINMSVDGNLAQQRRNSRLHFYDYIFITKHRSISRAVYGLELFVICWEDARVLFPCSILIVELSWKPHLVKSLVYVLNSKVMSEHM